MWDEVIPLRTVAESKKFRLNEYRVRAGGMWLKWYALFEYLEIRILKDKKLVPYTEWKKMQEMTGEDVHQLAAFFKDLDLTDISNTVALDE